VLKTGIAKEMHMDLKKWESTIDQIVEEIKQQPQKSSKNKILIAWRVKLEKEPFSLQPFQIDEIVREVQQRTSR
jgi:hypothetical protein